MSRLICLLACLGGVCFFCGCGGSEKRNKSIQEVSSGFLSAERYKKQAVNAAGGLNSWRQVNEIELDCVVTIYNANGSSYLTEQVHRIYPRTKSIEVSSSEARGMMKLKLTENRFEKIEAGESGWFSKRENAENFCRAVLEIMAAPVVLLDNKIMPSADRKLVEIDGSIYKVFYREVQKGFIEPEQAVDYTATDKLYLNQESFLIDMIEYGGIVKSGLIVVKGFYYRWVSGSIKLPARIEIYSAHSEGTLERLLVKIEYI